MADVLNISLTGPLADDVRAAAEARGMSPEDYVRAQLAVDVAMDADGDDLDLEEDLRRLGEPGENISLEEAFAELREQVAAHRAGKS